MLFQDMEPGLYILGLILGVIIVTLIIYIAVILIESKTKAKDKVFLIILLAIIVILVLPIVLSAVSQVLDAIGGPIADIRDTPNYLILLAPIVGFLLLLVLTKYLIDLPWDNAIWISLLTLFILYILFTIIPELHSFIYKYEYIIYEYE